MFSLLFNKHSASTSTEFWKIAKWELISLSCILNKKTLKTLKLLLLLHVQHDDMHLHENVFMNWILSSAEMKSKKNQSLTE